VGASEVCRRQSVTSRGRSPRSTKDAPFGRLYRGRRCPCVGGGAALPPAPFVHPVGMLRAGGKSTEVVPKAGQPRWRGAGKESVTPA